jgi:hypothetical protein
VICNTADLHSVACTAMSLKQCNVVYASAFVCWLQAMEDMLDAAVAGGDVQDDFSDSDPECL